MTADSSPEERTSKQHDARRHVRSGARRRQERGLTTQAWLPRAPDLTEGMDSDSWLDCGWGRLIFGQTFADHDRLLDVLREEEPGRRDICIYVHEPHVLVSRAPQELFLDPSYTYRMWLHQYRPPADPVRGLRVRKMRDEADAAAVNRVYAACQMVTGPIETLWANQRTRTFTYLVAEDAESGDVVGTVTGVDHGRAFGDPEQGTSLWSLAVDPQASLPGVGEALVRGLLERYKARGRAFLDLTVVHDNAPAIRLYEKLGFERVPVFSVKRKNPINEPLFAAKADESVDDLNPYARIIADEAFRRGITVEVEDAETGLIRLSHGGRTVVTRESLSELTSAVAMTRCDDKRVTRRLFERKGLRVPRGRVATFDERDQAFQTEVGRVVVKPARGEQGAGISVGVESADELERAVHHARNFCPDVLIEELVEGADLRIVVIDHQVVAAAIRRPAAVLGTGKHTIRELIERQSRRRAASTGGESTIPLDDETRATVDRAGYGLDDVLPEGERLAVRRTANLHTGGTIHDVTADLHPRLADVAQKASRALDIPVVGLDLIVTEPSESEYVLIEANERPGLANHEPQPTAQRFIDLLFPATRPLPQGWAPDAHEQSGDHRP